MNSLVDGLSRDPFDSYVSIQHNVDQSLAELNKCLKKVFKREAIALQQSDCNVICGAAIFSQRPLIDAPEAVDESLTLTVGHAKHADSAKLGSLLAHLPNCDS